MSLSEIGKEQIISNLKLHTDNPDLDSDFFNFNRFSEQLRNFLIDYDTPTPYTIGLNGEWGSGKTSLVKRTYLSLLTDNKDEKVKIVWFDAWEYERLDPVSALLYNIAMQYPKKKRRRFEKLSSYLRHTLNFVRPFSAQIEDAATAAVGAPIPVVAVANVPYETIMKDLSSSDMSNPQPTITQELQNMMGTDGRLIVFVDDLDRCEIGNVLDMLAAIKLFLNTQGVVFVIAVDMTKIERAWELKYRIGNPIEVDLLKNEGKDHVDKIFQLKLSLPPKDPKQIESYINKKASSLPVELQELLINGCPHNPRKIKRILNLIRYLVTDLQDEDDESFNKNFPVLVIWSIITVAYPELAAILKESPGSLTKLALMSYYLQTIEDLHVVIDRFLKPVPGSHLFLAENLMIPHNRVFNPSLTDQKSAGVLVGPSTLKGLKLANNHPEIFKFLKQIAKLYSIHEDRPDINDLSHALEKDYGGLTETLTQNIYHGGLIS